MSPQVFAEVHRSFSNPLTALLANYTIDGQEVTFFIGKLQKPTLVNQNDLPPQAA